MKTFFSKTLKILAGVALLGAINLNAAQEGVDYVKLDKPLNVSGKTLVKVFSYACPFCYKYDKTVTPKVVDKLKAAGVTFEPYHLKTKGEYGEAASKIFAVLAIKDQAAGVGFFDENSLFKKAKMAYYKAYHDKKERWGNGKDEAAFLKTGLEASGLSQADFEAGLQDPKVQELLSKWDASYDVAKVQGVPAFVVNGKYLLMTSKITSIEGMAKLVEELSAK